MNNHGRQNLILITNLIAETQAEIDLHALEWRLPDSIDDANNTPDRKLSSSLFDEDTGASRQSSQDFNFKDNQHCEYYEHASIQLYQSSQVSSTVSIICISTSSVSMVHSQRYLPYSYP
jgi:hypothetical protein